MATLIDDKGLQHYADKMVKAENRKVGTKSLPTALTEIDAMIDSMKGKFEQAYGDAIEETFENTENTFKIGTGIDEDRAETVEDGFISIDKLEGKTLVNRLKGENKTVQLPHRIELEDMIIKPNTDYTFQSSNGSAVASFKQPKYQEVVCQEGIKLENNLDVSNKIEFRSLEGQTLKNISDKRFYNVSELKAGQAKISNGYITLEGTGAYVNAFFKKIDALKTDTKYTLIFDFKENTIVGNGTNFISYSPSNSQFKGQQQFLVSEAKGVVKVLATTKSEFAPDDFISLRTFLTNVTGGKLVYRFYILEGDYTQKDVPDFIEDVQGVGLKTEKGYKIGVKTHGKNLLSLESMRNPKTTIINGVKYAIFTDDGNSEIITNFKKNTQYTITLLCKRKEEESSEQFRFEIHYTDGTKTDIRPRNGEKITTTSERQKTISKIKLARWKLKELYLNLNICQLEEGTQATKYEPYKESTSEIILTEQLQGIGDIKDRLYFDEGYKVEKNFKEIDLTRETYVRSSLTNERLYFVYTKRQINDIKKPIKAICNKLEVAPSEGQLTTHKRRAITVYQDSNELLIGLDIQQDLKGVATVEQATQWIKENNLKLMYATTTPIITDTQLKNQIKLDTYQPTYFTVDSGIAPSKTIIDVPVLEQITGKSGALRTPATLDRVYLDIQGSGEMKDMMLFEGMENRVGYINTIQSVGAKPIDVASLNTAPNAMKDSAKLRVAPSEYLGVGITDIAKRYIGYPVTISADVKVPISGTLKVYTLGKYSISNMSHHELKAGEWTRVVNRGGIFNYQGDRANGEVCNLSFFGTYDTGRIPEVKNIKISIGNYEEEEMEWVPHVSELLGSGEGFNKTAIALQEPLRSLPNGIKDTIERIDGEWKIIRRCGEKVVDEKDAGSWGKDSSLRGYAVYFLQSLGRNRVYLVDKLPTFDKGRNISGKPYVTASGAGFFEVAYPATNPEDSVTNDNFKKWIKENPLRVIYQLDTPVIESVSPLTLQGWKSGNLLIEDPINVASTHTVALNKPGQILKNIEELTILRDRVEKLEANYDQIALEQAHQLALTKQSIELDYEL